MKRFIFILFVSGILLVSCTNNKKSDVIELKTKSFQISLDRKGYFSKFIDIKTGKDYLAKDTIAPLMSIRINNEIIPPESAELKENKLILKYKDNIEANIKLEQKVKIRTKDLYEVNTQLEENQVELEVKQEEIIAQRDSIEM